MIHGPQSPAPMPMVTDPVCGMRLDADDAAAIAEVGGEVHYFCSEACLEVYAAEPVLPADRLSLAELARRSRSDPERIRELVALGILEPDAEGMFPRRDVMRARAVAYLQTLGIDARRLGSALASGHLRLGYLESANRLHPRAEETHAEISARIGIPFESLERIYVAFGLSPPERDAPARAEDLPIHELLLRLFEAGVVEGDVLRMARVWGESARRVAQYLPQHFHATVEESYRRRGMGDNEAFETAIREVGLRAGRSGEEMLGWLFRRHSEAFMAAHQVDHVEAALEEAGLRSRPPRRPEAIVFADLSGFTQLTEASGDEVAADISLAFAQLAGEVAARHRGRTVKLLGDGVLLHFPEPADAVRASLQLTELAPARGLPAVHAGVNAGSVLYDEGEYLGGTVNLAARIGAQAPAGSVYVGEALQEVAPESGFRLHELGEFRLKGIARPVRLFEARPAQGSSRRSLSSGPR